MRLLLTSLFPLRRNALNCRKYFWCKYVNATVNEVTDLFRKIKAGEHNWKLNQKRSGGAKFECFLIVNIQKFRVFPHSEVVRLLLDLQPTLQTGELPQPIPKIKTRMKANIEEEPITCNRRHWTLKNPA